MPPLGEVQVCNCTFVQCTSSCFLLFAELESGVFIMIKGQWEWEFGAIHHRLGVSDCSLFDE